MAVVPSPEVYDRIVVGGGAMGLATTWRLARRGARVLLLEQFAQGHENGASHGATRNLNNAYAEPYFLDLFDESVRLYRELEEASGAELLTLCGLVTHGSADVIGGIYEALSARGVAAERISPEAAAARWPGMRFDEAVLVSEQAGRIDARGTLRALASEAKEHGAELRWNTRVERIETTEAGVRVEATMPDGRSAVLRADGIVVTAGAWTDRVLRELPDLADRMPPLRVTEEHPAHFQPTAAVTEEQLRAWPSFNHLRAGMPHVYGMLTPGEGVKVGYHGVGREVDPDRRPHEVGEERDRELRAYVAEWMPGLDPATAAWVSCTYTSTPSEDFVLDRVGPVTIGTGFSGQGFKFVPAVGRVLAEASLDDTAPAREWTLAAHTARAGRA
jgi:monomeric sarcosine oxidase